MTDATGKNSQIKLLLFDIGGVLIENQTFVRLDQLLPRTVDRSSLKQDWLQSLSVRRFELGHSTPDEFAVEFISEWGLDLSTKDFLAEFYNWPTDYYPGARETIHLLRKTFRVGCLSNSNVLHWKKFDGFNGDFDIAMSSHQIGAIKPDADAFHKALDLCGADPDEVCFFDDSIANIEAAKEIGIRAYHVEGFDVLYNRLQSLQLV